MRRAAITMLLTFALVGGGPVVPTHAGDPDFGRVWAADKVLKKGCHGYRYQYRVKPGGPEWSLETFLVDPRGETIASNAIDNASNDKRGHDRFRFCRYVTKPGKFKIRGKLSIYETEHTADKVVWVEPGYFRMRRPG